MRLFTSLAVAALAGLAAAGDAANVYLYRKSSSSQLERSTPSIPKELARQIFLQRLSHKHYGADLEDLRNIDEETAISYLNRFGKSPSNPFVEKMAPEPKQLMVLVEGYEAEKVPQSFKDALAKAQDHFQVSNPPSSVANIFLMGDLNAAGAPWCPCGVDEAVNEHDKVYCWSADSAVVKYNLQDTDPENRLQTALDFLAQNLPSTNLEALVVLIPESSRSSHQGSWAASHTHNINRPADLRLRQEEVILSERPMTTPKASSNPFEESIREDKPSKKAPIPACFASLNTCETRTNNCSGGHGRCVNRYADQASHEACFSCHCMATLVRDGTEEGAIGEKTIRWGGNMCQKQDISSQFWLLVGFTILIVGTVTFAIGLLYSVGEEPLPGVIGAGVSRSK